MQPLSNENEIPWEFEGFVLDPVRRVLSRDGKAISLKPKIFDTLLVLIKNRGRVMSKDELMRELWPDSFVEEVNLAHNISILRKALGQTADENRFIVTVPGKGYRFVAVITQSGQDPRLSESNSAPEAIASLGGDEGIAGSPGVATAPNEQTAVKAARAKVTKPLLIAGAVIVIGALSITALVNRASRPRDSQPFNQIKSIAVLPFKPLVVEGRDESLEMGMADTLITRLSNIRSITVRPIGVVRKYVGLDQNPVQAGREQRVDAVVDGQIQRSGDKIRVTVRLVRVHDEATLWTNQFDEKMTDIFQVEDSISERVAGVLALQLTGEEKERLTKHYTDDAEAYQLYLIGRYHVNRLTDDGFIKGLDYFQRAVEKDPNFALAHAGMADAYNSLGGFNVRPPKEVFPKARAAALTALNLDHLMTQAHTELAMVDLTFDWDWPAAEREFKQAIEINPSDPDAHYYYSYYLAFTGQFDSALMEIRRAQELDPVSLVKLTGLAQILLIARRYDESIVECRRALDMDPNLGFAHWLLGLAYMYKAYTNQGSYDAAILELQKSVPLSADSPDEPASLGQALALSGKKSEARAILDELNRQAQRKYVSPGTLANLYWLLGEKDRAFALFDKAFEDHDNMMVLLKVEPMFDPLRSDPRFDNLVKRLRFP